MYYELAKALAYTLVLSYFRVFGWQAALIYFLGTLLLLAESSLALMPEKVLAIVSLLLLTHILAKGAANKKVHVRGKVQDAVMAFIISSALLALLKYFGAPRAAAYVVSLLSMALLFGFASKNARIAFSAIALALLSYMYFAESAIAYKSLLGGIVYSAFFTAYKIAYECISYECVFKELKPGMLPLEFLWIEKNELQRCGFFEGILRRPRKEKDYILSPLAPVCEGNMEAMQRIGRAFGSNTIKVQATIDARPYVIAGILLAFL